MPKVIKKADAREQAVREQSAQKGAAQRAEIARDYRTDFPLLQENPGLAYLDSAATALKPQVVIDAVSGYYRSYSANVHRGLYALSERATIAYEGARDRVAKFVNAASAKEIIFTRGTTEAINLVARAWGEQYLKQGDEIILSILEHHSNIVPWQMLAKRTKCILKFIDIDDTGTLKIQQLSTLLTKRTKLIALTHVSNALGTVIPLKPIIQKAHAAGARVLVDGAQSTPHMGIDVRHLDCDFFAFSGHKLGGPTGIGVLYAKEKILQSMEPFMGGGDMIREVRKTHATWNDLPWKFEAGTPPIAEAIGLGAAIDYLSAIGMGKIRMHERELTGYALKTLQEIPGVTLYGPRDPETQSGIVSFGIEGVHSHDIAAILDSMNIAIRAGHHCCMPLMDRLKIPATARASFSLYNTKRDVEKLAEGIQKVKKILT